MDSPARDDAAVAGGDRDWTRSDAHVGHQPGRVEFRLAIRGDYTRLFNVAQKNHGRAGESPEHDDHRQHCRRVNCRAEYLLLYQTLFGE